MVSKIFPHQNIHIFFYSSIIFSVFHNAHLPLGLVDLVLYKNRQLKKLNILHGTKAQKILCFAAYQVLLENQAARSPEEISFHFETDPLEIWKIEKLLGSDFSESITSLAENIVGNLLLPFEYNPEVIELIYRLQQVSCAKPETIIGAAVRSIALRYKLKSLTLEKISRVCGVAPASIRLLMRRSSPLPE